MSARVEFIFVLFFQKSGYRSGVDEADEEACQPNPFRTAGHQLVTSSHIFQTS